MINIISEMSRPLIYLTIFLIALSIVPANSVKKLIFVQELFRHGARYPINPHRNVDMTDYVLDEHSTKLITQDHYGLVLKLQLVMYSRLLANSILSQSMLKN